MPNDSTTSGFDLTPLPKAGEGVAQKAGEVAKEAPKAGEGSTPTQDAKDVKKDDKKDITQSKEWQEAWGKHQSAVDKKVSDKEKEWKTRLEKLSQEKEEVAARVRDQEKTEFVRKLEESGVDKEKAAWLFDQDHSLAKREKELREREAKIMDAERYQTARDLVKKHTLPEDIIPALMDSASPTEMRVKALEAENALLKSGGKLPQKTDGGSSGGTGRNLSELPPQERASVAWEEFFKK